MHRAWSSYITKSEQPFAVELKPLGVPTECLPSPSAATSKSWEYWEINANTTKRSMTTAAQINPDAPGFVTLWTVPVILKNGNANRSKHPIGWRQHKHLPEFGCSCPIRATGTMIESVCESTQWDFRNNASWTSAGKWGRNVYQNYQHTHNRLIYRRTTYNQLGERIRPRHRNIFKVSSFQKRTD